MSQPPILRLGPFQLVQRVGRGSVGEVWAADHRADRRPALRVAVKLFASAASADGATWAAFERELHAIAALHHPRIVRIDGHGRVTAVEAKASEGLLPQDAPYLVMEYAPGGTLVDLLGHVDWTTQRRLLLGLLEALAHAHARGLLHQDIKPSNILLVDGEPKLADFGIARHLERASGPDGDERVFGTPGYMAPEQIRAEFRDFAPRTDLFAVGVVAYALATGSAPFPRGAAPIETMRAQLLHSPRELRPALAVPPGLEEWILRLLDHSSDARFELAADAAHALRLLDRGREPRPVVIGPARNPEPSRRAGPDETTLSHRPVLDLPSPEGRDADVSSVPPLPPEWRPDPSQEVLHLVGAGLDLYGLRAIPLVGRAAAREVLWGGLARVTASRQPHAIVLQGPSGCGKSRLAQALIERAHEVGGALHLRAMHGAAPGPFQGLGPMIERHLRCAGLDHGETLQRIARHLRHRPEEDALADAQALTALMRPDGSDRGGAPAFRFESMEQRFVVIERLLADAARVRPTIVWLDDAQWGPDALAFADHLLAAPGAPAVLLLLIVQSEALTERRGESARLTRLLRRTNAELLEVAPLTPTETRDLVQSLLGFSSDLAVQVERRTAGNPLFAVELVRDWVHRGLLEAGPRGLQLAAHASVELPADLAAAWFERIERLLAGLPPGDEAALELAAVLGQEVDGAEWATVCALAGITASSGLLAGLARWGLARVSRDGRSWSFVHGLLRESVERRARDADRAGAWHRVCAELLGTATPEQPRRLAAHFLAAGRPGEAVLPLLRAVIITKERDDARLVGPLLDQLEGALRASMAPPSDLGWFALKLHRLQGHLADDESEAGAALAVELEADALAQGSEEARGFALRGRANVLLRTGRLRDALGVVRDAVTLYERLGDGKATLGVLGMLAFALIRLGEYNEACDVGRRRLFWARSLGYVGDEVMALGPLMQSERLRGRRGEARRVGQQGLERAGSLGYWGSLGSIQNELGELARADGDLALAETHYRASAALFRRFGYGGLIVADWNLALVHLQQGRWSEARAGLLPILARVQTAGTRYLEGAVLLHLSCCAAADGAADEWDARMPLAARRMEETGYADPDLPVFGMLAARLADERGWTDRASVAVALARAALRRLDREADSDAIDAELARAL